MAAQFFSKAGLTSMLRVMRALVLCLLCLAASAARAAEWTIIIGDYYFSPTNLTIAPGDTVTWVNQGFEQHDTTASDGSWVSELLFSEGEFTLAPGDPGYPFNQARAFPYVCLKHVEEYPGQTGLIVVASINLPPSVQIASPVNGSSFLAPASFTITAEASDSDGIVTNVQFFANGNPIGSSAGPSFRTDVSALPAGNYSLTATATDNQGAAANSPPVNITVTNPPVIVKYPLATAASPAGGGLITAEPPQPIDGYNSGTVVMLTASAANGFAFSNWSGSVSSAENPLALTMDAAKSITANFVPNTMPTFTLALSVNPTGSGAIEVSPAPNGAGGTYLEGTVVTLTAVPAFNFAFTNFSGDVSSASNPLTFTMNANRSVTANFFESIVPTFTLTVITNPPGSGTIQVSPPPNAPAGRYTEGTLVTLTATAVGTNAFANWTGAVSGTSNPINVVMDSDKSVTANFVPIISPSYTLEITVTPTNGGTVLVTPGANSNGTYGANTTVALSAQPNAGFRFVRWTGAITSSNALVLLLMNGPKSVTASFEAIPPLDSPINGIWAGLLIDERETNYTTTGFISLRVSKKGAYRGTTTIVGMRNFVAGQFDSFGYAPLVVRRATLRGSLQIDDEASRMTGSLTDGRKTPTLLLYRVATPTNAELFAGSYDLLFGALPPVPADGIGAMVISASGAVRLHGTLGDGTSFAERTFITADGRIPLFVQLYGRRGDIAGWLSTEGMTLTGSVRWFRPGNSRNVLYPEGFSLLVPVTGARF